MKDDQVALILLKMSVRQSVRVPLFQDCLSAYQRTLERCISSVYEITLRDKNLRQSVSYESIHSRISELVSDLFESEKDKIIKSQIQHIQQLQATLATSLETNSKEGQNQAASVQSQSILAQNQLLELEIRQLRRQLQPQPKQLQPKQPQMQQLPLGDFSQREQYKLQIESLLQQTKRLKQDKCSLQEDVQNKYHQINNLQEQIKLITVEIQSKQESDAILARALQRKDDRIKAQEAAADRNQTQFKDYKRFAEGQIVKLQQKLIQVENLYLERATTQSGKDFQDYSRDRETQLLETLSLANRERAKLVEELAIARQQIFVLESKIALNEQDSRNKLNRSAQNEENFSKLVAENAALKSRVVQLNFQLQSLSQRLQNQLNHGCRLKGEAKALASENKCLAADLQAKEDRLIQVLAQFAALQEGKAELQKLCTSTEQSLEQAGQHYRQQLQKNGSLRAVNIQLEDDLQKSLKQNEDLRYQLDSKKGALLASLAEQSRLRQDSQVKRLQVSELSYRLANASQSSQRLGEVTKEQQQIISQLRKEEQRLAELLKEQQRKFVTAKKQLQIMTNKKELLLCDKLSSEQARLAFESRLEQAGEEVERLKLINADLEFQVEDQRSKYRQKEYECKAVLGREETCEQANLDLQLQLKQLKLKSHLLVKQFRIMLGEVRGLRQAVKEVKEQLGWFGQAFSVVKEQDHFARLLGFLCEEVDDKMRRLVSRQAEMFELKSERLKRENSKLLEEGIRLAVQSLEHKNIILVEEVQKSNELLEDQREAGARAREQLQECIKRGDSLREQNDVLNQQLTLIKEEYSAKVVQLFSQAHYCKLMLEEYKSNIGSEVQQMLAEVRAKHMREIAEVRAGRAELEKALAGTQAQPSSVPLSQPNTVKSRIYSPRSEVQDHLPQVYRSIFSERSPNEGGQQVESVRVPSTSVSQASKLISMIKEEVRQQRVKLAQQSK